MGIRSLNLRKQKLGKRRKRTRRRREIRKRWGGGRVVGMERGREALASDMIISWV